MRYPTPADVGAYAVDALQRSVLFLDILRERGNQHLAQARLDAPTVLSFGHEVVLDGRQLERPVNYLLLRIVPPEGMAVDPNRRPFVIVDPRAGHGPGIGGMKPDSEIGVALEAGHPTYFIGFLPAPVPGQTLFDVGRAEARFIATVAELHPNHAGKPCVVGNCQAGWAVLGLAAAAPELMGPLIVAGAPVSYWGGVQGMAPMRYAGGLLGGSWLASLASDLGHGIFDGAYLIQNFENLNPANTWWTKQYDVWKAPEAARERYLGFEKWWGAPTLLAKQEIEFIVNELFIGNKLVTGEIEGPEGRRVDLRELRSPVVVFCSQGDEITPPQQALGWILDLYADEDELIADDQTIVYSVHPSTGHLGIFVSGKVARREHEEFTGNIDLIDVLPPGIFEAVIRQKGADEPHLDLLAGDNVLCLVRRGFDDLRAMGGNTVEDDLRFATVARLSAFNRAAYEAFLAPWVKAVTTEAMAELGRALNPYRLNYTLFSDRNPLMLPVHLLARAVAADRRPAEPDNPLLQLQEEVSRSVIAALDGWRELRDSLVETTFLEVYGQRWLQELLGVDADRLAERRPQDRDERRRATRARIAEQRRKLRQGGLREATVRALVHIGRASGMVDERHFAMLRAIRAQEPAAAELTLPEFKRLVREQFALLVIDEPAAIDAIPRMLPKAAGPREAAVRRLEEVVSAAGAVTGETAARLARMRTMFLAGPPARAARSSAA